MKTVIFVDDGSTDGSSSLLEQGPKGWNSVLLRQANGGQSSARNNALNWLASRGYQCGYVMFLDADDMLVPNALSAAAGRMIADDLDELFFTGTSFFESASLQEEFSRYETYYKRNGRYEGLFSGPQYMSESWRNGDFYPSPCMQMLKASFLLEYTLFFEEGIIHEDNLFTWRCLLAAKKVGYLDEPLYLRRIREGSTMTKPARSENVLGYFRCGVRALGHSEEVSRLQPAERDAFQGIVGSWFSSAADYWENFDEAEKRRTVELLPPQEFLAFRELVECRVAMRLERDEAVREAGESAFVAGEQAEHQRVLESPSFRLGRALTMPVRKVLGR